MAGRRRELRVINEPSLGRREVLGGTVAKRTPGGLADHDRPSRLVRSRSQRRATGTARGRLST